MAGLRGRARPRRVAAVGEPAPPAGRGRPAAADQQLHRRRRARPRARPRRRLRRRPARPRRRRPGRAARHPRDDQRPGLAALARPRPRGRRPRRARAGRCSASAAASRCSGARSPTRRGRGRAGRRRSPGLGLLDVRTDLRRRQGAAPARRVRRWASTASRLRDPPRPDHRRLGARSSSAARAPGRCSARCGTAASRATRSGRAFLARGRSGLDARPASSFPAARERRLDLLGDLVEEHLDVDALLDLARDGAAAGPAAAAAGGAVDEGPAARRHRGGARARGRARRRRRRRHVVAGRPRRATAAAGRGGADRRLRRGAPGCARRWPTTTPSSTRPIRSRSASPPTRPPPAPRPSPAPAGAAGLGRRTPSWHWVDAHDEAARRAAALGRAALPHRRAAGAGRVRPGRSPTAPVLARVVDVPDRRAARRPGGCSPDRGPYALAGRARADARAPRSTCWSPRTRAGPTPGPRWRPPPSSACPSSSYAARPRPPGVRTVHDVDEAVAWVQSRSRSWHEGPGHRRSAVGQVAPRGGAAVGGGRR